MINLLQFLCRRLVLHRVPAGAVKHFYVFATDAQDPLLHLINQGGTVGLGSQIFRVELDPVWPVVPVPLAVGSGVEIDCEGET